VEKSEKITSYGYIVKSSSMTVFDASIKMAFKLYAKNRELLETRNKLKTTLEVIPDCSKVRLVGCSSIHRGYLHRRLV